jgi:predicted nuclease with RNAse H fold
MTMDSLGIDLASKPKNTAICVVHWDEAGRATVGDTRCKVEDQELLDLARKTNVVTGIDCPFGWPDTFVRAVSAYHESKDWPAAWAPEHYHVTCFRRTDHFVHEETGLWPLSVSSDRIAIPAMRCAWLLSKLEVRDRSGDGRIYEVYPAAALRRWELRADSSYKGRDGHASLNDLVARLKAAAPWLDLGEANRFTNDHLFDALLASLNARAAALGLTHPPSQPDAALAKKEGWIALPHKLSLRELARRSP